MIQEKTTDRGYRFAFRDNPTTGDAAGLPVVVRHRQGFAITTAEIEIEAKESANFIRELYNLILKWFYTRAGASGSLEVSFLNV